MAADVGVAVASRTTSNRQAQYLKTMLGCQDIIAGLMSVTPYFHLERGGAAAPPADRLRSDCQDGSERLPGARTKMKQVNYTPFQC